MSSTSSCPHSHAVDPKPGCKMVKSLTTSGRGMETVMPFPRGCHGGGRSPAAGGRWGRWPISLCEGDALPPWWPHHFLLACPAMEISGASGSACWGEAKPESSREEEMTGSGHAKLETSRSLRESQPDAQPHHCPVLSAASAGKSLSGPNSPNTSC